MVSRILYCTELLGPAEKLYKTLRWQTQFRVSSAFCFPPFYEVNSNGWLTGL